jgi:hypothetical protein
LTLYRAEGHDGPGGPVDDGNPVANGQKLGVLRMNMLFKGGSFELELVDESTYTSRSADNIRTYAREHDFTDNAHRPSSRHGLVLSEGGVVRQCCILLAGGGASGVHEHSVVIVGSTCFVAVGDTLCSLALPSLGLLWYRQVDTATCFGVHFSAKHDCLISHGELEIARVSLSGEIVWSSGGEDIFSEGLKLHPDYVEAVDFNRTVYRLDIATGASAK